MRKVELVQRYAAATSTKPVWELVNETDWSAQASSTLLSGAGTVTGGGKTITAYLVGGTGVFQTQVVNGSGLQFACTSGQAGAGSCGFRYDLDTTYMNIAEPVLVEYVITGISAWGTDGQLITGIGSGNNFSNGEHYGFAGLATAGPLLTAQVRRYSTTGGANTASMTTGLTQPTDVSCQVLYMGNVGAMVAVKNSTSDYFTQPQIGASAPFDASSYTGNTGSDARTPTATASETIFGTNFRIICGVGLRNMTMTLKKVRVSRMTRM